jgi:hypothetical protein
MTWGGQAGREIASFMKPRAILSAFTFTAGTGGILKYRRVPEWSLRNHGLRVFELSEMEHCLAAVGLKDFEP